jgi:hydroxymethylbilane synthase
MTRTLRLATRQSPLALWQANFVRQQLLHYYPDWQIELVPIVSEGDKILDRKLADFGGKGLFIKALEQALLDKKADFAVHSLKDVPPVIPPEFMLAAFLKRADPRDALCISPEVSADNARDGGLQGGESRFFPLSSPTSRRASRDLSMKQFPAGTAVISQQQTLADLPANAIVGISSPRRTAQLLALRPDLHIKAIRGNVQTRLTKLAAGEYDALMMAVSGLERVELQHHISQIFSLDEMLPSVGQGVLVVECLTQDSELCSLMQVLDDADTSVCAHAERALVRGLQGNCHSPIGAYAQVCDGDLLLRGLVANFDGTQILRAHQTGTSTHPEELGKITAQALLDQGAKKLLENSSGC